MQAQKRNGLKRARVVAMLLMLSVVIPTRNDERGLVPTLASLVTASADGVLRDVTLADGGSTDATLEIADLSGCSVVGGGASRGARLDAAARRAKGPWLMFVEPGVALERGWHEEVRALIETLERRGEAEARAAVFRFKLDSLDVGARLTERLAGVSRLLTGLPRPEQGLVLHKRLYERSGGFRPLPAMAEADLVRRIGPRRLMRLRAGALAPASQAEFSEPGRSGAKAAIGAGLLMLRVPPRVVARLYG